MEATAAACASEVPDERELLMLLGEAARCGSVPAMRELLAYHRERPQPQPGDVVTALDELAARRLREADR